jgi:hypothetical protein
MNGWRERRQKVQTSVFTPNVTCTFRDPVVYSLYRNDVTKVATQSTLLGYLNGTAAVSACGSGSNCLIGKIVVDSIFFRYRAQCDHVWVRTPKLQATHIDTSANLVSLRRRSIH